MQYSLEALYISLIIMCIILWLDLYSTGRRHLIGHTIFYLFISLGLIDISLDIITTYLIEWRYTGLIWLTQICMVLFFGCQIIFPYLFFIYSARLKDETIAKLDPLTKAMGIPTAFLLILCIFNPVTHLFYSFNAQAEYIHGPLYLTPYVNTFLYVVLIFIRSLTIRRRNKETGNILILYLFVLIACVIFQLLNPYILTTGLGIGLGIMALYMNISNPHEFKDYQTGAFNTRGLFVWLIRKKKPCYTLIVYFPALSGMSRVYGPHTLDQYISQSGIYMVSKTLQPVFRVSTSEFLLFAETENEARTLANDLRTYFDGGTTIDKTFITGPVKFCIAGINQDIYEQKSILEYSDYLIQVMDRELLDYMEAGPEHLVGFHYEREIERYLETAIEQDLFELAFQPLFSLKEQRYTQMEVLSRLHHPTLGYIPPTQFIAIAEQKGSIDQISFLQFHRLCRFLKAHPALMEKVECIKFNLSPHELIVHDYGKVLPDVLRSYGLPSERFAFEITETAAIEHSNFLEQSIETLLRQGCRINMDDFGSGYANLNTLLKLPYECIKLDRSLLEDICCRESSAILYHDLIDTFHRLGFVVVSEGVETQEEYDLVSKWGTDLIQGYWFSKPVSAAVIEAFFVKN